MRTGGCTIQQTLTAEAASVLKHSLNLARRRGHAQVTPLHVAATLLSSQTSLLRRACVKSHPGFSPSYSLAPSHHHHLLQCRALELCFNVALNRLPTVPGPIFHGQPSLANALIAALKRAQAHQKRGCLEQQQQSHPQQPPPLLIIKVELEQLVISILDDPSVNRVMREAGFSSTAVKNCIEDCSVSTVFYGSSVGVFSSPCSPSSKDQQINRFHHQNSIHFHQPLVNPNTVWQTRFLDHSPQQNPPVNYRREDVKLVFDVLVKRKRNPVIVGDSVSFTEELVSELMSTIERVDSDHSDLKQPHLVKFQLSSVELKFMRREDVETKISELGKEVVTLTSCGKSVIIYSGDLKWTVEENNNNNNGVRKSSSSPYSALDHMVEELGRLIAEYNKNNHYKNNNSINSSSKTWVWVMGTASYQTYMRCQMRQPSLETLWSLQAVSVPSGGLGLSLHSTSCANDSRKSNVPSQRVGTEEVSVLSCCPECVSNYETEAKPFKSNQEKLFPCWLRPHGDTSTHNDELIGLRRKWNKFCKSLHQGRSVTQSGQVDSPVSNSGSMMMESRSFAMPLPNQDNGSPESASVSFADSGPKQNQRDLTNSVAKFRRQNSCTIGFDLGIGSGKGGKEGKGAKVTQGLSRSLFFRSDSSREMRQMSVLAKALQENIPWQSKSLRPITEILMDYLSSKKDAWIMVGGSEIGGKRRLAIAVTESLFGSSDVLVHIDLRERGASSEILASALQNRQKLVFLIEDIDSADAHFLKLLCHRFDENKELKDRESIFILTKEDSGGDDHSVLQMSLNFTEQDLDRKRKPESDLTPNETKNLRTGEKEKGCSITKREILSRQTSFNSSLDLNVKAEESDEEEAPKPDNISPISSDLTADETHLSSTGFLGRIKNRFVFERYPKETRGAFAGAFGEIYEEEEEEEEEGY